MKPAVWFVYPIGVRSGALTPFFINVEVPENCGHQVCKFGVKLALFFDNLSFSLILCCDSDRNVVYVHHLPLSHQEISQWLQSMNL